MPRHSRGLDKINWWRGIPLLVKMKKQRFDNFQDILPSSKWPFEHAEEGMPLCWYVEINLREIY